jgi:hypothetical protein
MCISRNEATMDGPRSLHLDAILDQVETWPAPDRIRLARRILESVEQQTADVPHSHHPGQPLDRLLGWLSSVNPVPDDAACRAILEDELARKHLR